LDTAPNEIPLNPDKVSVEEQKVDQHRPDLPCQKAQIPAFAWHGIVDNDVYASQKSNRGVYLAAARVLQRGSRHSAHNTRRLV
jgi:hypothetical protein